MSTPAFIKRVTLKNYKSIAECSVELQPLTFLVGPNGSGKSNFLDALHFVSDALNNSLEYAIRVRQGIFRLIHYGLGSNKNCSIRLDFQLANGATGTYAFCLGSTPNYSERVTFEECYISSGETTHNEAYFRIEDGELVAHTEQTMMRPTADRLYLAVASALDVFRPVYDALSSMAFYGIHPDALRFSQAASGGETADRRWE